MKTLMAVSCLMFVCSGIQAQEEAKVLDNVPKVCLYVDPSSRWISMHDSAGTGAKAEFTLDILKACSQSVVPVDQRETADYTVSFDRTGISSGSVVIYAKGDVVNSFKPGHASTLQKVADTVCEFVKSRK
jgi:hypothetical protein